ncbi:hypothetical protein Syun_006048 [Stephania yunnanensis]|uniref:Uncharacterized protein n=1 Tax=Stephania yunnanensis TaxID=152371 RepID=A0AAP0KXK5_9MAGN
MHNMPSSFQASHHSSHADIPSRHDTPLYTPSVPLNEFGTAHTPLVPPNMTFEAMEDFPFDTTPISSRHFHASPIMMNLFESTSTHDGECGTTMIFNQKMLKIRLMWVIQIFHLR